MNKDSALKKRLKSAHRKKNGTLSYTGKISAGPANHAPKRRIALGIDR